MSTGAWRVTARRSRILGLALLALHLVVPGMGHAATIRNRGFTPTESEVNQEWTGFLARPSLWANTRAPNFSVSVRRSILQSLQSGIQAQSSQSSMIDYLLWRRAVNPIRFTANHSRLAPLLMQSDPGPIIIDGTPPVIAPVPQTIVPDDDPLVPSIPQVITPPSVPEPASLLLAAGMVTYGIWWRRRITQSRQSAK